MDFVNGIKPTNLAIQSINVHRLHHKLIVNKQI